MPGRDGNGNYAAAGRFDFFAPNNLVVGPVAAFDQNVRQKGGDNFAGSQLVEDHHGVDRFKRSKNFRALEFGQNRTATTLQLAHTAIAIDSDNQHVTQLTSGFQRADVPGM